MPGPGLHPPTQTGSFGRARRGPDARRSGCWRPRQWLGSAPMVGTVTRSPCRSGSMPGLGRFLAGDLTRIWRGGGGLEVGYGPRDLACGQGFKL